MTGVKTHADEAPEVKAHTDAAPEVKTHANEAPKVKTHADGAEWAGHSSRYVISLDDMVNNHVIG